MNVQYQDQPELTNQLSGITHFLQEYIILNQILIDFSYLQREQSIQEAIPVKWESGD